MEPKPNTRTPIPKRYIPNRNANLPASWVVHKLRKRLYIYIYNIIYTHTYRDQFGDRLLAKVISSLKFGDGPLLATGGTRKHRGLEGKLRRFGANISIRQEKV